MQTPIRYEHRPGAGKEHRGLTKVRPDALNPPKNRPTVTRLSELDLRQRINHRLVVTPLLGRRRPALDVRLDDYVVTRSDFLVRTPEDFCGLGSVVVVPIPSLGVFSDVVLTMPRVVDDPLAPLLVLRKEIRTVLEERRPIDVGAVPDDDLLPGLSMT